VPIPAPPLPTSSAVVSPDNFRVTRDEATALPRHRLADQPVILAPPRAVPTHRGRGRGGAGAGRGAGGSGAGECVRGLGQVRAGSRIPPGVVPGRVGVAAARAIRAALVIRGRLSTVSRRGRGRGEAGAGGARGGSGAGEGCARGGVDRTGGSSTPAWARGGVDRTRGSSTPAWARGGVDRTGGSSSRAWARGGASGDSAGACTWDDEPGGTSTRGGGADRAGARGRANVGLAWARGGAGGHMPAARAAGSERVERVSAATRAAMEHSAFVNHVHPDQVVSRTPYPPPSLSLSLSLSPH